MTDVPPNGDPRILSYRLTAIERRLGELEDHIEKKLDEITKGLVALSDIPRRVGRLEGFIIGLLVFISLAFLGSLLGLIGWGRP